MISHVSALILSLLTLTAQAGKTPLVLMYHNVVKTPAELYFPTDITAQTLAGQLDLLQSKGYQTGSLQELSRHLKERKPVPKNVVYLTFDDGYFGIYENAYPELKKRSMHATFFVHTAALLEHERLALVKDPQHTILKVSWDDLKELGADPLISIQPHSLTHPYLHRLTQAKLQRELLDSKKQVEDHLGGSRSFFAYPFGAFTKAVARATQSAGYSLAFGITPTKLAIDPRYKIPRFAIKRESSDIEKFNRDLQLYIRTIGH